MATRTFATPIALAALLVATPITAADQHAGEVDEASAIVLAKRRCGMMEHGMEREGPWGATRNGDTWIVFLSEASITDGDTQGLSKPLAEILGEGPLCVKTSIRAEVSARDGQVRACTIEDNLACP
jgi:hypothetical protein